MAQATLQSQTADSLYNWNDAKWDTVIGSVIGMVSLILEDHDDLYLIDRVTIVRGFAELSLMYPNTPEYRQRLTAALLALSETLSARDDSMSAAQVKSLSDRCRKFDKSAFKDDNSLTVYPRRSVPYNLNDQVGCHLSPSHENNRLSCNTNRPSITGCSTV